MPDTVTAPPADVARVLDARPVVERQALTALRQLILDTAEKTQGVGPLTETLKWGEPAYLTDQTRSGSTLRIGPYAKRPGHVAIFVNCRTQLADTYRERHPELEIDGDRAVVLDPARPLPEALADCIRLALTYHRWRRGAA